VHEGRVRALSHGSKHFFKEMDMSQNVHLVIIDPQIDFCARNQINLPVPLQFDAATRQQFFVDQDFGTLTVPGAAEDVERIAKLVTKLRDRLRDIHVTLDSHHLVDIAHPQWWKNPQGGHPAPFTIIEVDDVEQGNWTPALRSKSIRDWSRDYVKQLADNDRYPLCIWPPHCLIATKGALTVPVLEEALMNWEHNRGATVDKITKGSNPKTEHYSAVMADVPIPNDAFTQLNAGFIRTLEEADEVLLCGEAGSHCLANTVRDVANNFADDSYIAKLVLLEDGTSPVPGFEQMQTDFIKELSGRGMRVTTTTDYVA